MENEDVPIDQLINGNSLGGQMAQTKASLVRSWFISWLIRLSEIVKSIQLAQQLSGRSVGDESRAEKCIKLFMFGKSSTFRCTCVQM